MEENKQNEHQDAAGNTAGSASEAKPKKGFWKRITEGRGAVIAVTAVIALIVGLMLGHHMHRWHCDGGCCGHGGHAMMMRRGFGPRWGGRFGGWGGGMRGEGQMHGQMGMDGRGMGPMGMNRPGMGPMGMGQMGMRPGFDPDARIEQMKQQLGLNDQQAAQIKAIFEAERAKVEAAMKNMDSSRNNDWRANREQLEAQIKAVLTPDQQAKWQQQMAGRMGQGR